MTPGYIMKNRHDFKTGLMEYCIYSNAGKLIEKFQCAPGALHNKCKVEYPGLVSISPANLFAIQGCDTVKQSVDYRDHLIERNGYFTQPL